MTQPLIISASLLSADFSRLGEEARQVLEADANWLHFDVMDNHYVPNLTFGVPVCAALRRCLPTVVLDAHLMTDPVDSLIEPFAEAGANFLTFHPEATAHPHRTAARITAAGMKCGVALNPATPLSQLDYLLDLADMVLLMTVNPGFGGQRFIRPMLDKITVLRRRLDDSGRDIRLQVDGGINAETAPLSVTAGADTLVAGNAIFGSDDYAAAVRALRATV